MAWSKEYLNFILEQLSGLEDMRRTISRTGIFAMTARILLSYASLNISSASPRDSSVWVHQWTVYVKNEKEKGIKLKRTPLNVL